MKKIIVGLLIGGVLNCFIVLAFADVYRYVDEEGVVTYSDQPKKNATPITLPPMSIAEPATPDHIVIQAPGTTFEKSTVIYKKFSIINPNPTGTGAITFQNPVNIEVGINIDPILRPEDKIQLLLDGNPVTKPQTSLTLTIPRVDEKNELVLTRGTHTLQAIVLDKNGKIISKTEEITIYIHQHSILP